MKIRVLLLWIASTALAATGCTVSQVEQPPLTGPSALATSLNLTANPDTLVLNGQQSVIVITALDASGTPQPNLRVHLDVLVNGAASACGRLSQYDVITAIDGRSNVVFTAPTVPLPLPECAGLGGLVTIRAFPIGTDAAGTNTFRVNMNLLTPIASTTAATFAVNFTMTPSPANRNSDITFSNAGSVSPGHTITSYQWAFSDGNVEVGPTVVHDFGSPGTYTVTLTITDDIGQSGSKSALITIF